MDDATTKVALGVAAVAVGGAVLLARRGATAAPAPAGPDQRTLPLAPSGTPARPRPASTGTRVAPTRPSPPPATSPPSSLPETGEAFFRATTPATRDTYALAAFADNRVAPWVKDKGRWVRVVLEAEGHRTELLVAPDYFAVGRRGWARVPVTAPAAQRMCDALHAVLPTPKIVDAVWRAASTKLPPRPQQPRDGESRDSNRVVEAICATDAAALGGDSLGFVAGLRKDYVVPRDAGKVAIYGWHQLNGSVIQGYNPTSHSTNYRDYSQNFRPVDRSARIDGVERDLVEAYRDPRLRGLFTREPINSEARERY